MVMVWLAYRQRLAVDPIASHSEHTHTCTTGAFSFTSTAVNAQRQVGACRPVSAAPPPIGEARGLERVFLRVSFLTIRLTPCQPVRAVDAIPTNATTCYNGTVVAISCYNFHRTLNMPDTKRPTATHSSCPPPQGPISQHGYHSTAGTLAAAAATAAAATHLR